MHFICLHGVGTNSEIFEAQTAALRFALGDRHTYEFVDGTLESVATLGSDFILAADSTSQAYFDPAGPKSCRNALAQLATYLELEGPFDGVLAFSQGAVLAATLLVQAAQNAPHRPVRRNYGLKCAVFISGGPPADPSALGHDDVKVLSAETVGEIIQLPTAHIWDPNDTMMPGSSAELSKLCSGALKSESLHNLGHEVPGPRSQEALNEAVHAVRRTVERAALAQ